MRRRRVHAAQLFSTRCQSHQRGYDLHDVLLTPRNWSRVKRGGSLKIRSSGMSECGPQWEYWYFFCRPDGDLVIAFGDDGSTGFIGSVNDAIIEDD